MRWLKEHPRAETDSETVSTRVNALLATAPTAGELRREDPSGRELRRRVQAAEAAQLDAWQPIRTAARTRPGATL